MEHSYHYAVIARAIAALDEMGGERVSLDDLSARLGMSPAHFQRVFTAWVGVSPKRYQQYLALTLSRDLLARRHSTLETALTAGLSGAGRLHDLFLRWEAMTPGEFARGAAGLAIRWDRVDSPYGAALVAVTDRGICGIAFEGDAGAEATLDDMRRRWPAARMVQDAGAVAPLAQAAFGGGAVPVQPVGAPFQIKVWEALVQVPEGAVTTYSDLAAAIGQPRAARAVGSAVGRNPLALLIPCHRVIQRGGGLGGYHWGLPVKRAILAREAARCDQADPVTVA
jgi:AraC family transcriptional regulator of adaptative response/methylated-DNA-[protein]-cysteine methyltransferase